MAFQVPPATHTPTYPPGCPYGAPRPVDAQDADALDAALTAAGYLPCPTLWPEAAVAGPLREGWCQAQDGTWESVPYGVAWAVLVLEGAGDDLRQAAIVALQAMRDDQRMFSMGVSAIQTGFLRKWLRRFGQVL